MSDKSQKQILKLNWQDSSGKDCAYFFEPAKLLGIRVTDEGFNYMNWKKFFYGLAHPTGSLNIQLEQKNINYHDLCKHIKMVVPRPIPRFVEALPMAEVMPFLQSINLNPLLFNHPITVSNAKEKWSSLPMHKRIIFQILAGLDAQAKMHFILLERVHLNAPQSQMVHEFLNFVSAQTGLSFVILGHPSLFPAVHWVPLLKAPVLNAKFTEYIEDDEDADEDAA